MKFSLIQGGQGLPSYARLYCCFRRCVLYLLDVSKYVRANVGLSHSFCGAAEKIIPFLKQKSLVLTSSVENTQDSSSVLFQALWPDLSVFLWLYEVCQKENDTNLPQVQKKCIFIFSLFVPAAKSDVRFCIRGNCTTKKNASLPFDNFLSSTFPLDLCGVCAFLNSETHFIINSLFDLLRKISPTALLHI